MGPTELIVGLALAGFLLMAAETFVPGIVLGILGGLSLIGAVVVAYVNYGMMTGTLVLAGVAVLTFAGFVIWMTIFPHTAIGRRIMLQETAAPEAPRDSLLGREGKALTPLRPAGAAVFDGRKLDVVAEGELIEPGEPVVVAREDGMRILVRKSAARVVTSAEAR